MNSWPKKCSNKFKWRRCIAKCTDKSRSADMHKIDIAIRVSPTTYREMCGVFVMHMRRLVYLIYCRIECKEIFITTDLQGFITGAAAYSDCRKTLCKIYIVDIPFKVFWFLNNVSEYPIRASAVSMSSEFIEKFKKQHWMATKRVIRCLRKTVNYGLLFTNDDHALIADWGANHDDFKFYTRYISIFINVAVNWEARKQNTVALSGTAAEYMELSEASEEAIHLRQLFDETTDESKKVALDVDNHIC
ncbi:conserved hypothetical protein [Trichinella spiralis]|uniref:hypothetical protein n=1 Tax=Trichinella spiralis TaxID=6334 RepID=UPI0001EFD031|nr:conserved hypothetical protein [Trichinella spiralis]